MLNIKGVTPNQVNLDATPGRLYVRPKGDQQIPGQLILTASGFKPGTEVYWSFKYRQGHLNPDKNTLKSCFFTHGNFDFNPQDQSSQINQNGQASVRFTGTTYAGDCFQFGVDIQKKRQPSRHEFFIEDRLRWALLKSKPFRVWKRIFLEPPKVLKHVQFPVQTWEWVIKNLERLHIEIVGSKNSIELDPSHPDISHHFNHTHQDLRYGPRTDRYFGLALQQISNQFSDRNPKTINIIILGALSKDRDLIGPANENLNLPPQPVNYLYPYRKRDINLREASTYGTGYAIEGACPSIVIFSDFWFMASKILDMPHEKILARVILHELGHHLLMHKTGGKYLDPYGHPLNPIASYRLISTFLVTWSMIHMKKGIMHGVEFIHVNGAGKTTISSDGRNSERQLIKKLVWNKEIERLIRKDFLPQK